MTVLLALGCSASLSADARLAADLDASDGDPAGPPPPDGAQLALALSPEDGPDAPALLGARHDLTVTSSSQAVNCRCVAALLGAPTMSQVQWQGPVPRTRPETQLLVALAPDTDCPGAPTGSAGASYWGYRVQGQDVIVLLEAYRPKGRAPVPPRTIAAIIPKPPNGGQVYLAPVARSLPFGKALEGKDARCALGNPGPERAMPLSDEEQGLQAPDSDVAD